MTDIDVFSVIGKNGKMCASFLYETMNMLRSNEHSMCFKAMMSSCDPPSGWEVQEFIPKLKHTSLNHTTGLNSIKNYVSSSKYLIISDADMAPLCQNWDKKLVDRMQELEADVFGVGYWSNIRTYSGFPIVTFFIVSTEAFLKTNCDFRPTYASYPNKSGVGCNLMKIENEHQSEIYQRPMGWELLQDSGWRMPMAFREQGYRGAVLDKVENPHSIIEGVSQMWHIDDEPILAHLGKSTKRSKRPIHEWHDSIKKYLESAKA